MYTDLLTKLRNAQKARKEMLKLPYSNMDFAVAELLGKYNFVENVSKKGRMPKRVIEIKLKYDDKGQGAIGGVRFISKPSRRIYLGYKDLKAVRQGYGISALSTPKGVMSNLQARKDKVGGQLLFEIW